MGTSMAPELRATGVAWWNERFADVRDDRISFSTSFLPALLKSSRLDMPASDALSVDELRVVAKYCVADSAWQHDTISLTEFLHFLARFGPIESSLQRVVESFTVHRELVTWFHGTITRTEAENVLLKSSELDDGAFLVRFSESQPTRFCLSYVKVHSSGAHVGRRDMRNVLIENIGENGFVLTDSRTKAYPSIRAFIQRSASRLKHGITSGFARRCNLELAAVRVRQDLASNSYTAFSTDSLDPSSSSSSPVHRPPKMPPNLLFARSPEVSPRFLLTINNARANGVGALEKAVHDDSEYAGFSLNAPLELPGFTLKAPITPSVHPASNGNTSSVTTDDYAAFSATAVSFERSPPGSPARSSRRPTIPFITPPVGSDYGDFSTFTAAVTSFNRVPKSPPHSNDRVTNTMDVTDEYASFESIVEPSKQLPARSNGTTAAAQSEHSMYGSFDQFDLTSSQPTESRRSKPVSNQDSDADYGSFVTLTGGLLLDSEVAPKKAATTVDDTYGSFSLSPVTEPQTAPRANQAPPLESFALGPPPPHPPKSLPSNIYGSFEALTDPPLVSTTPQPPPPSPPHSVPADLPSNNQLDTAAEVKPSALDFLNAGMEFYKQKQLDDALLQFIQAREVARSANDQVVEARALGNLGTAYLDKQNPSQAVACYEQCLRITRSIKDVKRERTILNNLVLALMAAEDFESAYKYCQIQLETTVSDINRRKILSRMSLLREKASRASRDARSASTRALAPPA